MTSLADTTPPRPSLIERASHWTLLRIPAYILAVIVPVMAFEWSTHFAVPDEPSPYHAPLRMVLNLLGAVLVLGSYRLLVRVFERRPAVELDVRAGAPPFCAGLAFGAGLLAAVYLLLWALGCARFAAGDGLSVLWPALVGFFCVGVAEEVIFRGIVFRLVEQAGGTTVAIVVSGLFFGFAHALNDNATVVSCIDIAVEAGILLALAYVLTRNLWFVIGIHTSWNLTEGTIFGGTVSGEATPHALVKSSLDGPDWLTGGAFGLEASPLTLALCLILCVVLGWRVAQRGEWRPATRFRLSLP